MATDHAIMHGISISESMPTIRFYRWRRPSVTLGYFQKIAECVNTVYCRENGISVTRRETGGGTVLHYKELTYSFTVPVNSGIVTAGVEDSFKQIISPIINSLNRFSVRAEYRPVNDIVINNRKISGSAQLRKKGVIQQHGTIIMDMDNELIRSALIRDEENLKARGFVSMDESITSVRNETGAEINDAFIEKIILSLIQNFSKSFNAELYAGNLSENELVIMKLYSKKFESDEWNFKK